MFVFVIVVTLLVDEEPHYLSLFDTAGQVGNILNFYALITISV